ncbi:MAG: DNA pilot protein [Microviridae sp.]|nr:MAG: DNA pilot protein [Microviridae sp.]
MSFIDYIPFIGSAVGAAASYRGQREANETNLRIGRENNAFSAQQAAMNRDFQERMVGQQEQYQTNMSNTAWQRGVADMRAAGINPMLAFSQGGASSPMGSSASGNSAQGIAAANQQNEFQASSGAIRDAADFYLRSKLINAQVASAKSQADLNYANAKVSKQAVRKVHGDANVSEAEGSLAGLGFKYLTSGINSAVGVYKGIKSAGKSINNFWTRK